jgi:hypothetical protein
MQLVHGILGRHTKTHVVVIDVDHQPTKNPAFKVFRDLGTCVQKETVKHALSGPQGIQR